MNKFVCLVGVLAFAVCVQCVSPDEVKKIFDECAAEIGTSEKPNDPPHFKDQKVKCYEACLMKKLGELVDGKVSLENVLKSLAKHMPKADDTLKAKFTECVNTANQQSGECEVAGAMRKCIYEKLGAPPAL